MVLLIVPISRCARLGQRSGALIRVSGYRAGSIGTCTCTELPARQLASCAMVRRAEAVWCGGFNSGLSYGESTRQFVQVGAGRLWGSVSVGGYGVCAISTVGYGYCWGSNYYGQLGLGGTTDRHAPMRRLNEGAWSQVAVGSRSACGVRPGGTLRCWGHNGYGELGLGDTLDRSYPTTVG